MFIKLNSVIFGLIFTLLFLQNSVAQKKKVAEAPIESYQYSDKQVKTERFLSTMNIGLKIALSDIENQINNSLKGLIYEDNSMEDNKNDQFMCKVWKRDEIKASTGPDNSILYFVPLKIWVKAGYEAAPMGFKMSTVKETEFDFNINLKSSFSISPKWEAISKTSIVNYEFVTSPKIKLGPLEIPITPLVKKALDSKQDGITQSLDQAVKDKIEVKKYVIDAWNSAIQPSLISEEYNTWLKISPLELQMTPVTCINNQITGQIGIKCYTETVTGAKPTVNIVSNVPDLVNISKIPNQFQVGILSEISHEEALKVAKKMMLGQKFEFQEGKYAVTVKDMDIYGTENQLVIKTDLEGSLDGTIYFKGNPYFDEASKSIKLQNFDYDLKTKNLLAKAASWLMGGKLAKTMQASLEIPCAENIEMVSAELKNYMNKKTIMKGVVLNGQLNTLKPDKIFLTPTSIIARTMANGQLEIDVKGI